MRPSLTRSIAALTLASFCALSAPAFAETPTPIKNPSPAQIEEAKRHMQAGAAFYNDPSGHKCEEALREFAKAYEISGSLNALKGMATCNLELERDGDAIEQYTKYLEAKGASIDPADKKQIETDLNALKSAVAWVTLAIDVPRARLADTRTPSRGFPITNRYTLDAPTKRLGIHPGQHTFTVSVEGQPDQTWTVEILNGGTYDHAFSFGKKAPAVATAPPVVAPPVATTPAPPKEVKAGAGPDEAPATPAKKPAPIAAYVFTGLTAALAVPTVIFMVRAKGLNDDYAAENGAAPARELEAMRSDVQRANLVADVFLGVTAASAIAMTTLYIVHAVKKAPAKQAGGLTVAPALAPSGGGALVMGSF